MGGHHFAHSKSSSVRKTLKSYSASFLVCLEVLLSCWKVVRNVLRHYKCMSIIVPQNRLKIISWAEITYSFNIIL
jgi:hypothetical protein